MEMMTAEAEFVALTLTIQYLHALKRMITGAKIMPDAPGIVCTNNKATWAMVGKEHSTKHLKFIDIRHQYIQHLILRNQIQI